MRGVSASPDSPRLLDRGGALPPSPHSPNPLSPVLPPFRRERGGSKKAKKSVSLLSRRKGGRTGEEGRGGEGPKRRSALPSWATIVVTFLLFLACRPPAPPAPPGRIRVAVSVPPQAYFVERIGGHHVEVEVMIPPGYSHVDYPLTPRQIVALSRARLYVAVGHPAFEFEQARIVPLLATLPNVEVVDMSRGMHLLAGEGEGSEHDGHSHAAGDPHVWVAPESVAVAARNIAAALERIDSAHAAEYRANLQRFESDIAALDREIRLRLAPERGGSFMVYHPTWGYFAHQYGLRQVSIEAEGKEPSAGRLIQLIDEAKRQGVKVVFVQRGFPRKSAQVIADAVGGQVLVADPQERDWLGNLRRVTKALSEALGEGEVTSRVLDTRGFSAASFPSLPQPLSPTSHPPIRERGELKKQLLVSVSLLSRTAPLLKSFLIAPSPRRRAPHLPDPPLPPHTHPAGRGGRRLEETSCFNSPLSRQGGCEAGERGWGSEGPEAAEKPRASRSLDVRPKRTGTASTSEAAHA